MSIIKKLASQTAWYGMSSIVGRMLNVLLTPVYTYLFLPADFGIISLIYAYMAFANVLYTYGMETAFFYFSEKQINSRTVFSTSLTSVVITSVLFSAMLVAIAEPLSQWLHFGSHPEYLIYVAVILAFDAMAQIAFAVLRKQNRVRKFAFVKIITIAFNVMLNLFFLWWCPHLLNSSNEALRQMALEVYNPEIGVGYVFMINVASSGLALMLLSGELTYSNWKIDFKLLGAMLGYSLPLLVAGLAGMVNETLDRILLNFLISDPQEALHQQGIYGACYKLSMFMSIFIQAFRFAAEPFFFARLKGEDNKKSYGIILTYFVIAGCVIFSVVTLYIDVFKYFIGPKYWEGLHIVPILLVANLCLGVYLYQSMWYKVSGQTRFGAYFSLAGAFITIVFNLILIPLVGYTGAAWTTLICYAFMMVLSYITGQKYYPVNYNLKYIGFFFMLSLGIYFFSLFIQNSLQPTLIPLMIMNTLLLLFATSLALFWIKKNLARGYQ